MAEVKTMLQNDYGYNVTQIATQNPQANAILERIHQTIGNMIRTYQLPTNNTLDEEDPFSGLLSAVAFATRATVHTTLGATPSQLVFGRDAITNTPFEADWEQIRVKKQKLIDQNNARENAKRTPHTHKVGDKVWLKTATTTKFGQDPCDGPCDIVTVNDNGAITHENGSPIDKVNIRNVHPHKE